jgi:hypothetical protein
MKPMDVQNLRSDQCRRITKQMLRKARAVAAITLALFMCLMPSAHSQRPEGPRPIEIPRVLEVPRPRARVEFDETFTISEIEAARNPEILNQSMRARRDVAWQIIDRVWGTVPFGRELDAVEPWPGPSFSMPVWMTWYEQEDIAQLYEEMLRRRSRSSRAETAIADVTAALRSLPTKDIQASLNSARLGRTLRQFTFPNAPDIGPHRGPSTGSIYYSPAYVKHLLANAERIARCDPASFPTSAKPRSRSLLERASALDITDVPAELRPADPKNTYALCMDHEMPPDAVMVKTAWAPLSTATRTTSDGRRVPTLVTRERLFRLNADMASHLFEGTAGRWVERPLSERAVAGQEAALGIIITDESDRKWLLVGMHIAAKTVRNWIWISIFLEDDWGWRAEPGFRYRGLPAPIFLGGQSYWYGMCVVSDFVERDPRPSSAYDGVLGDIFQEQADTIRAVTRVMRGNQWCSNPYIESNMARGNCIGCHQGSPTSFMPTTLSKQQGFNVSDFSFSFATNRANIIAIRRRYGLDSKPKSKAK